MARAEFVVRSWARVAELVGNNRSAQPCRGRWRRLKRNDQTAAIRKLSPQMDEGGKRKAEDEAAEAEEPFDESAYLDAPPDRPGWTAAWSDIHKSWYWWNQQHQTTWDDPALGEPTLVAAEPTPWGLEQAALQASSRAGYGHLSAEEQAAKTIEDKVKARLKKDPDAPKKPMSAYIAFAAKRRCATRPPSPTPGQPKCSADS